MYSTSDLMTDALGLLRAASLRVGSSDSLADLELVLPGRGVLPVQMKAFVTPPQPSVLTKHLLTRHDRDPGVKLLLVLPRSTPYIKNLAQASVLHLLSIEERLLVVDGVDCSGAIQPEPSAHPPPRRRGRPPWVRWAVERILLLTTAPISQADLADLLRVSPQSVSKALKGHQHASRTEGGWVVHSRRDLLEQFMGEYPGPGGAATYWYGLDAPMQQARDARQLSNDMGVDCLQTGDIAADHYSPWRMPVTATLYVRELLDFVPAGFASASRHESTLVATVPEDPTIWRTAVMFAGSTPDFVDPIVALHDVTHGEGTDAHEAADRLRAAILDGTLQK